MSKSWALTVLNDQDETVHQGSYCTLADIATIFGLKRGSDLAHYRVEPNEHTRQLMLDRFGLWFLIDEEDSKPLPTLEDFVQEHDNDESESDDYDSESSSDSDSDEDDDSDEEDNSD